MVLQAHRAKGVRYPTASQKECFKTWYSYALRQGEVTKTSPKVIEEHAKHLKEIKEAAPEVRLTGVSLTFAQSATSSLSYSTASNWQIKNRSIISS
ncbi:major facilitator superfamily like protein [Alternaria alternata]|nr:major facilitator superfamily like protein [Alternaria alternata]